MTRIQVLNRTCPSPKEDLELDDRLLDECDRGKHGPALRFWESPVHCVVLGTSSQPERDVNDSECERLNISILRRSSGGGTVLIGPGCLNFSLVLPIPESGPLRNIQDTTCFILTRHRAALEPILGAPIESQGTSDLTLGGRKFSGNAQRRKRRALLFHGTFLYDFDLSLVERVLHAPLRQPAYRSERSHKDFLINLPLLPGRIRKVLEGAWSSGYSESLQVCSAPTRSDSTHPSNSKAN
ncbi:MAG: lipoate--protein ligase family protein [Nitrospirae bacterium]|nr:lipoate--protein ligase family protein [Nitrospirota bacterium]